MAMHSWAPWVICQSCRLPNCTGATVLQMYGLCRAGRNSPALQTTAAGNTVALVGTALVTPAASLCVSTDVALHSAAALAATLAQSEPPAAEHNEAMDALARAALLGGNTRAAMVPLGMGSNASSMRGVRNLCRGEVVRSRCAPSVGVESASNGRGWPVD